jgi:predicted N-acetyltransferase YhbS
MSVTEDFVVRDGELPEVLALRMRVLRPGQEVRASDYDGTPGIRHVVAVGGEHVVGCATVFPSPYEDEPAAWQLRGMAVEPGWQKSGVGGRVLRRAIELVTEAGAPLLWANARVSALGFYVRLGFEVLGEEFVYGPSSLPHRVIVLPLSGAARSVAP